MIRELQDSDWNEIATIYRLGIEGKMATFETTVPEKDAWFSSGIAGTFIGIEENQRLLGYAKLLPVSTRPCYKGVGEVTIYLHPAAAGKGIGSRLLKELVDRSEKLGFWTLKASIFPENVASLRIHEKYGFRQVGRHEKIAKLDGEWRDTVLLERRSKKVI